MAEEEEKDNPGFVTHGEFAPVVKDVDTLQLALFGKDGRGGIVNDIAEIKHAIKTMNVIKVIGVSILVAVITALILRVI